MKILMITPSYEPVIGGTEIVVNKLALNLNKIGIETDVLTFNMADHWDPVWKWEIKKEKSYKLYRVPAFNPFIKLKIPDPVSYLFNITILPDLKFRKILNDYDVLHFHDEVDISFPLFSSFVKKPTIFQFHTLLETYTFYKRNIFSRNLLINFPDLHITSSKSNTTLAKDLGAMNVEVLPNGVDIDEFTFNCQDREEKSILFVGRIEKRKGVHILLEALDMLEHSVELTIIGPHYNDEYSMEIFAKIHEKSERKHKISYLGPLNHDNIIKILKKATIFVCPSMKEYFGMVVIEAMSCGAPVIASDIGGIKDMIDNFENGILVSPDDPVELAKYIDYLIDNKDLRIKLSKSGRKMVEDNYSWDSIAQRLSKIYKKLIKHSI